MARVIKSDGKYTGTGNPPILLDFLGTQGKIQFLKDVLARENQATDIINETNVDYISSGYSSYLAYVFKDGGKIGSEASVIKALAFAKSQAIDYNNFQCFGAKYGYKLSASGYVSKLYALGATNELNVNIADSVQIETDGTRKVLNFVNATSAFSSNKALSMLNGIIVGTSCRDVGTANTNSMRGVVLSGASNTTANAHTELGHNLGQGNFAKHYVASALATITDNAINDPGYAGLATIAKVNTTAKLFKNGTEVATGGTQMTYTLPNTYLFIANGNVANNKLNESWLIFGASEAIAAGLSVYLNS